MKVHELPATPETVHWGYFDPALEPVLTVESGDLVQVEALTHHAGDAPDLLMDDGIERVFADVQDRGPGPHLLTGPIAIADARPGTALEASLNTCCDSPYGATSTLECPCSRPQPSCSCVLATMIHGWTFTGGGCPPLPH